jgi:CHAT domain-containing protein
VENPLLRSGLALAGANLTRDPNGDGILTALEAAGLNLWGTKLVTLSACDTGVGEVRNGEGVYGLRRAFVLAGAETLVMSLWPVSDYMTREMMTAYYTGLRAGLGRGDALRHAKLAMLRAPRARSRRGSQRGVTARLAIRPAPSARASFSSATAPARTSGQRGRHEEWASLCLGPEQRLHFST